MKTPRFTQAWLSLALLLWLLPRPAAASPITLDGSSDRISLMGHLDALVDPGGRLGVEEVANRRLLPLGDIDIGRGSWPGQPRPIVWMRFTVRVPAGASLDDWYLIIGRPYDPGTAYVEQVDGGYRAYRVALDASGDSCRIPLPLEAGTRKVLLRVPGPVTRPSLLHVATLAGQEKLLQRLLTEQGLYLGVILAMLLVNLLMGVQLRDPVHLWYVGFITVSAAAFSLLMGTVSRFVLPTVPAAALFRPQSACLALTVLTGIQFSRLFLDTPRTAPQAPVERHGCGPERDAPARRGRTAPHPSRLRGDWQEQGPDRQGPRHQRPDAAPQARRLPRGVSVVSRSARR